MTTSVRMVDIPIEGSRMTLRVAAAHDGDEGSPQLLFVLGFGEGEQFLRPGWMGSPIKVPDALRIRIIDALNELGRSE